MRVVVADHSGDGLRTPTFGHGGSQPSGDALWVADVVGILAQRQPGGLRCVFPFFRGEPVLVADAVQRPA